MLAKTNVLQQWSLVWAEKGKLETIRGGVGTKDSPSKGWEARIRMQARGQCRHSHALDRREIPRGAVKVLGPQEPGTVVWGRKFCSGIRAEPGFC